jgi:hypothetical protein
MSGGFGEFSEGERDSRSRGLAGTKDGFGKPVKFEKLGSEDRNGPRPGSGKDFETRDAVMARRKSEPKR